MERILIVGGCGAGKSTLARALGQKLNIPVVHLDRLFWQAGWQSVSHEVFDLRLCNTLSEPRWIIDGNFDRTLPERLTRCDTVIDLNYPRRVCITGVLRRVVLNYGRVREDMADGCPEKLDFSFLRWIWMFPKNQRPKVDCLLAQAEKNGVIVLHFANRKACRKWLNSLLGRQNP
jgi:adenylate kinase family enzyme